MLPKLRKLGNRARQVPETLCTGKAMVSARLTSVKISLQNSREQSAGATQEFPSSLYHCLYLHPGHSPINSEVSIKHLHREITSPLLLIPKSDPFLLNAARHLSEWVPKSPSLPTDLPKEAEIGLVHCS